MPIKINDSRFEMVMVRRSLEAANAMMAGNSVSVAMSVTMAALAATNPCLWRPPPSYGGLSCRPVSASIGQGFVPAASSVERVPHNVIVVSWEIKTKRLR